MNFYTYLNEGHAPLFDEPVQGIRVYWNTGAGGDDHTIESRLSRAKIDKDEFFNNIKKFISNIRKKNLHYGTYGVIFKSFKIIAIYSRNRIFISTILTKDMSVSRTDFIEKILEHFKNLSDYTFENNSCTVVKLLNESVLVERSPEGEATIYGDGRSFFDIIEIE